MSFIQNRSSVAWLLVFGLALLLMLATALPTMAQGDLYTIDLYDLAGRNVGEAIVRTQAGTVSAEIVVSGLDPVAGSSTVAIVEGGSCEPGTLPDGEIVTRLGDLQRFANGSFSGIVQGDAAGGDFLVIFADVGEDPGDPIVCGNWPEAITSDEVEVEILEDVPEPDTGIVVQEPAGQSDIDTAGEEREAIERDAAEVSIILYDRQGRNVGTALVSRTAGEVVANIIATGFDPAAGSSAVAIVEDDVCRPPNMPDQGEVVTWLGNLQRFGGTTLEGRLTAEGEFGDFIAIYSDVVENPGEIIACGVFPNATPVPIGDMDEAEMEETDEAEAMDEAAMEEPAAEERLVVDIVPTTLILYDRQDRAIGEAEVRITDGLLTADIRADQLDVVPGSSMVALVSGGVCAPPDMPDEGEVVAELGTLQRFGGNVIDGTVTGVAADEGDYLVLFDDVSTEGDIILCSTLP